MYKLLLCVRYLRTRYLAFICIVSVMLGVATLIVVNAVMSGFSTKLKDRLHGVLSDLVVETERLDGFPESANSMIARIMASPAGDKIQGISPTIETFAILQFKYRDATLTKPIKVIGIDPKSRSEVGGFAEYLTRQSHSPNPSFDLTPDAMQHHEWKKQRELMTNHITSGVTPPPIADPNALPPPEFGPEVNVPVKLNGMIPGFTIAHFRYRNAQGEVVEEAALQPGDEAVITCAGSADFKPVWGTFLVADYLKTEMSEYDQSFVFVPLEALQKIRGMNDRCSSLQIKLKDYNKDKIFVSNELRRLFSNPEVHINTWEQHQGPLLAAIDVERGILNLLLFMIVGVAGFSILAIFTMIVSEKFRDIGILKSLGASRNGVLTIFLGYGLLLGVVGCGLGTALGLFITDNINVIEAYLSSLTGAALFPRDVYYFKDIPTNIDLMSVLMVNAGAVAIAVVFSLLPAYRAARLHPVRALRFE